MMSAIHSKDNAYDKTDEKKLPCLIPGNPRYFGQEIIKINCHFLSDAVIDRCVNGFRGWTFTDQAREYDRYSFEADRLATCEQRMENVITTLRLWNSACHNIVEDEVKAWVKLANAPMAYAREKLTYKEQNERRKPSETQKAEKKRGKKGERLAKGEVKWGGR